MKPRAWPVLLAAGIGLAILLSLGVWQLQRLAWKETLLGQIEARMAQPAVTLQSVRIEDLPYAKLQITGEFTGSQIRKLSNFNGGPGWDIIQPFQLQDGKVVLVMRGTSSETASPTSMQGNVTILGLARPHDGGQGVFDPDNNATANQWFWWDVAAMLGDKANLAKLPPDLVLHLLPGSPGTEGLQVALPKAELRNNHLGYAITWFGLAAALVVVTGVFLRGRMRAPHGGSQP